MQREEVDYVIAGFTKIEEDRRSDSLYGERVIGGRDAIRGQLPFILEHGLNAPYCKVYKTSIVKEQGIRFDESLPLGEDFNFNLEYLLSVHSLAYLNESLYDYMNVYSVATTVYREDLYRRRMLSLEKMNATFAKHGLPNPMEGLLRLKILYAVVFNLQKKACPHGLRERLRRTGEAQKQYFVQKPAPVKGKMAVLKAAARLCPPLLFYGFCILLRCVMEMLPDGARGLSV